MTQNRTIVFVAVSVTAYLTQIVCKRGRMWTKLSHIQEESFAFFNSIIEKLADLIDKKRVVLFVPVCLLFWYATENNTFFVNEVELSKIGQFCAAP
jgi:hypothetical protein